jgi:hypothetical protein
MERLHDISEPPNPRTSATAFPCSSTSSWARSRTISAAIPITLSRKPDFDWDVKSFDRQKNVWPQRPFKPSH